MNRASVRYDDPTGRKGRVVLEPPELPRGLHHRPEGAIVTLGNRKPCEFCGSGEFLHSPADCRHLLLGQIEVAERKFGFANKKLSNLRWKLQLLTHRQAESPRRPQDAPGRANTPKPPRGSE